MTDGGTPRLEVARVKDQRPDAESVNLADLLNVLWRRRLLVAGLTLCGLLAGVVYGLVVTPLYRATAHVRPGITAFTPEGGPVRDWRLKDITTWFQSGMYLPELRRQLGWGPDRYPIIRAEFIPQGLQGIQGGNIITLRTLDADPRQAETILHAAVAAFNAYAQADTVSNQLQLTARGLEVQVAGLRTQRRNIENRRLGLDLDIGAAVAESSQAITDLARVDLEMERIEGQSRRSRRGLVSLADEAGSLRGGIAELEDAIVRLRREAERSDAAGENGGGAGAAAGAPSWLLPALRGSVAQSLNEAVRGRAALQEQLTRSLVMADSLRQQLMVDSLAIEGLQLRKRIEIPNRMVALHRDIENLRLERDQRLPVQLEEVDNLIREKQVQLAALAPMERVGHVQVSERPVRPRKLRAVGILTGLALLGAVGLAFVWDYVARHRDAIFAPRARGG